MKFCTLFLTRTITKSVSAKPKTFLMTNTFLAIKLQLFVQLATVTMDHTNNCHENSTQHIELLQMLRAQMIWLTVSNNQDTVYCRRRLIFVIQGFAPVPSPFQLTIILCMVFLLFFFFFRPSKFSHQLMKKAPAFVDFVPRPSTGTLHLWNMK